ncbi:IclR family transcriptional regulator [Actinomadura decatromicini]|uniref:IclR family transcriptional regulator n=2 Tax=Actinomadura decatromicini TaxID=2604572 RepID=A0A5D3FRH6_9ACTN|nr:IclR family transcriptional regulator [Actinomadura decatromicini]
MPPAARQGSRAGHRGMARTAMTGGDPARPGPRFGLSSLLTTAVPADQNTLRRGIAALWHLSLNESLSVTELANLLPCDKSQASRVLKVLGEYGMVTRDPETQRYSLGWLVYAFSLRVSGRQMVSIAGPVVRKLATRTGQTCWIAVLSGHEVLTLYTSRPRGGQVIVNERAGGVLPGGVVPIYCTASGRALMSGLDDEAVEALLADATYDSSGPNAPRSFEEVRARLADARRRGYCVTVDELQRGTTSVAAPVHDGVGSPVLAIGLSGRTASLRDRHDLVAREVVLAGKHITSLLFAERAAGGRGAAPRRRSTA